LSRAFDRDRKIAGSEQPVVGDNSADNFLGHAREDKTMDHGSGGERRGEAHRRISSTTSHACHASRSRPSFRVALIDVSKYFPAAGRPDAALPVSLQFADSPTAEHGPRGQNRPAMMDSLEDKGAFMTKTKRNRATA